MSDDDLLEKAQAAVAVLFEDTSVSKEQTKERLLELREDIDTMLASL